MRWEYQACRMAVGKEYSVRELTAKLGVLDLVFCTCLKGKSITNEKRT